MAGKNSKQSQSHSKDDKPKVIIKKAKGHQGDHPRGAWKVAYADFVTAMMALFLVLWLLGASTVNKRPSSPTTFANPVFLADRAASYRTAARTN